MTSLDCTALKHLFSTYTEHAGLNGLARRLEKLSVAKDRDRQLDGLIELYRDTVNMFEGIAWQRGMQDEDLENYQALFRELEQQLIKQPGNSRHDFVIVVPVADRPLHLQECMHSLLELCRLYNYGGVEGGCFNKVSLLVADDSSQAENIEKHRTLCEDYRRRGLDVEYFGEQKQRAVTGCLSDADRHKLATIIGPVDRPSFGHKGASITRNISYLKLLEVSRRKKRPLFYFIDSDQEFKVRLCNAGDSRDVYAINYFYHLDRLFSSTDVRVLTGKVVGDPPVSPAVMASNLLDDVMAFLTELDHCDMDHACGFHQSESADDHAFYHDMAELFGFNRAESAFRYHCPIKGRHHHAACFEVFARNINRFFDGEHPTRKTCYRYEPVDESIKPARTLYTGNYVMNSLGLDYFIPFANLSLRMAGPTLGRLIRADIGKAFVSAGLPMLHKRTVDSAGRSEYRAGISHEQAGIDLSSEFERQFYGDVMLFTVEKLCELSSPEDSHAENVMRLLIETEKALREKYMSRHRDILEKLQALRTQLYRNDSEWNQSPDLKIAMDAFGRFMANMEYNYGEQAPAYQLICSDAHRHQRLEDIRQAILSYADDRRCWDSVLRKTAQVNTQPGDPA